jgi:transcription factor S
MMFCPKCGSLLKPKADKKKKVLSCSCGYISKQSEAALITEGSKPKEAKNTAVIDEKDDDLPVTSAQCPECENGKAFFWLAQTRAGDEPETKFLKCTKCKHVWRDYG